ncbi:MAG: FHA domain-containing protein, partial [Planctomycetota bacterium]|nr:FHA domain-containing protein [Planctomycetota bacterium]
MARLIVEEGGKRRAFRVGEGVLTIGTGAEAKLRLSSADVAEIHAELVIQGGKAVLRSRPGVKPPKVGGDEVLTEAPLAFGVEVNIGSARVWLEDEKAPQAASPSASVGRAAVAHSDQEKAIRRQQAISEAGARKGR